MIAFNETFPGSQITPPQGEEQDPRLFRVCHLSMGLCTGGLERLLVDFARYHDPNRFELTFVALDKVARPAEEIRQLGCNVKVIPNFGKNWQQFGALFDFFRSRQFDVVHTHNSHPHFWGTLAARWAGVPVIVNTRHGQRFGQSLVGRTKFWFAGQLADRVITVSEDAARLCLKEDHLPRRKVKRIWNGIDTNRFAFQGPMQRPTFISVARLSREKDFPTLLRAVAKASKQVPDLELLLVGNGPERAHLQQLVVELQIEQRVQLVGEQSDIPHWLARSGCFVSSSLTEGISLTLLEAMAVGLPVLATAVGGNPEIVTHGVTGYLVPAQNVDALADGIVRMWEQRSRWMEMGRAGRSRVAEQFDIRQMIHGYEAEYLEHLLLKNHGK
ncbi:MAG: glycosyltransferase [Planctomycetales bacterium]